MSEEKATYRTARGDDATGLFAGLFYVGFLVAFGVGWVLNIVKLLGADAVGPMELARAVGILVAPLGALLGYF
jgi:hypothetical protein